MYITFLQYPSAIIQSSEINLTWHCRSTLVYIHERVVRARQLASVAQLVTALHWNRRAQVRFLPGPLVRSNTVNAYKFPLDNFHLQYPST